MDRPLHFLINQLLDAAHLGRDLTFDEAAICI